MLEQAGYAILINHKPKLQEVFLTREQSKANRKEVIREFKRERMAQFAIRMYL